jgi:hypothetical protein
MHESGNTGDEPIDLIRVEAGLHGAPPARSSLEGQQSIRQVSASITPALHIPHAEFHRPIDIDVLVVCTAFHRLRGSP